MANSFRAFRVAASPARGRCRALTARARRAADVSPGIDVLPTGYDTFGYVYFQCLFFGADERMTLLTRLPDKRQAELTSDIHDIRVWEDRAGARQQICFGTYSTIMVVAANGWASNTKPTA